MRSALPMSPAGTSHSSRRSKRVCLAPLDSDGFHVQIWLVNFHLHRMSACVRVLACADDEPRYFDIGLVGLDCKVIVRDFFTHDRLRKLTHDRELVAKITVQGLEYAGSTTMASPRASVTTLPLYIFCISGASTDA